MTLLLRPILGAAMLGLCSSLSFAQSAPTAAGDSAKTAQAPLAVCRPDLAKLCPDAKGAKRRACLRDNTAKLSPECATAFADVEAKAKAMRDACGNDVKAYCKGAQGAVECLRANASKLTPACSAAFAARFGSKF